MKRLSVLFTLFIFLFTPLAAGAYPYSSILSFGDSLSDNGNADSFGIQRYTNGPVWVEYMASSWSVPLFDMAFGGATTGWDDPAVAAATGGAEGVNNLGLQWQVYVYLHNISSTVPANTLVTVWAGANDFFNSRAPDTAASNVALAISNLAAAGAQNILICNLPNIGLTPEFSSPPPVQAAATAFSQTFNADLALDLQSVERVYPAVNFYILDVYDLLDALIANPAANGFTDVTDSGNDNPPAGYLFWDGVHPTTQAHKILAQDAIAELVCPCDVNHDGKCNVKDDILFAEALLKCLLSKGTNCSACDLNGDGKCDQIDINLYLKSMKSGNCPCK